MPSSTPNGISDVALHMKNGDGTERIVLPFTRYANVLNAPKKITSPADAAGRSFAFLQTETDNLTTAQINTLLGVNV